MRPLIFCSKSMPIVQNFPPFGTNSLIVTNELLFYPILNAVICVCILCKVQDENSRSTVHTSLVSTRINYDVLFETFHVELHGPCQIALLLRFSCNERIVVDQNYWPILSRKWYLLLLRRNDCDTINVADNGAVNKENFLVEIQL